MRDGKREIPDFTCRMSRWQTALALLYLPVQVALLPQALYSLSGGQLSDVELNLYCYAAGALFMVLTQLSFLRRDFDPLCEHLGRVLWEVCLCYGLMLAFNLMISGALSLASVLLEEESLDFVQSPNNEAVTDLVQQATGPMTALAVFLAPLLEEPLFRGGVFGLLRRYNRTLAYIASVLLFSLYHVWSYALSDPLMWLYLLEYIPASYVLCRCYERTDSIWGSIFLHMMINFLALRALDMLQRLM